MFKRTRMRDLSSTVLVDIQLTDVRASFRNRLARDSSPSAVPADAGLTQNTRKVSTTPVEYPESKGMLYIRVDRPVFITVAGGVTFQIEHVFCINGTFPAFALSAFSEDATATVIQY